ncbi:mannose-6-phosphate isomerase, class I [Kocuria sp. cx-116]|nr:mannose-6-phosphate isomerase, class I [Kocuria sp. cx-116]
MAEFFRMDNPIQNYAWGSRSVLATMQGRPVPSEHPEAELWMGAHSSAPSVIEVDGHATSLVDVLPDLPFLLKILAIAAPLSIQVHPSTQQAREGFARDNEQGMPLESPSRNYKDDRAKPETVVALTDMWLLAGQRTGAQLRELAHELRLDWLSRAANEPSALRAALSLSEERAAESVRACVSAAARLRGTRLAHLPRVDEDAALHPAATPLERAVHVIELLDHHYPGDPGMLVALCMNLVHLHPGQAVHTPPQQLHAYISGTAVEVMGCSDNVLRAGLTTKHMDVPELLSVLAPQQAPIEILDPVSSPDGSADYPLWDTSLSMVAFRVHRGHALRRRIPGTSVVLVAQGHVTARICETGASDHEARAGHSLLYRGEAGFVEFAGEGLVFVVSGLLNPKGGTGTSEDVVQ